MKIQYLGWLVILVFLTGCSMTRSPSAATQMQIKVAQLERNLERKTQQIEELEEELSLYKSQNETQESFEDSEPVEEYNYSNAVKESRQTSSGNESKDDRIIRVAANAKEVQRALKNAGFYEGKIDGKFGRRSKKAVTNFQKEHDLVADGIIGSKTWSELKNYLD